MKTEVIILAAGQGTRMHSVLPKVLHCIAGKPMLGHVIDSVRQVKADEIHVVIGHGGKQVKENINDNTIKWVNQGKQLGTGHAVAQALPDIDSDSMVLVAYGDVPLVKPETLSALLEKANDKTLALLTVYLENPTGYGRIVRDGSAITSIVEQKDASDIQRAIKEVNTGILAVSAARLQEWLPKLSDNNAHGEYYLTDIIELASKAGMQVLAQQPTSTIEVEGVNNRQQLARIERYYQRQHADKLMSSGVTLADPDRLDIRGKLVVGKDINIDINCIFIGEVIIEDNVVIGPNCVIENSQIGKGSIIKANTVMESSQVGKFCEIGPFGRMRPGTVMLDNAKIGNFVETKKSVIGIGSKVNHLSYVGDTIIGEKANIGAGTITCNYDGVNKFTTNIGDGAFIGSNTSLVAPVNVGNNATVAAGSTITGNVGDEQLAVARSRQRNIDDWVKPTGKSK